jgi:nicotinate phosphoribosyltransferase
MLTDMYQISMTYAHWKHGKCDQHAVFDLFFRKSPFGGEYCVIAGLDEVVKYIASFKFTAEDAAYLQSIMPSCDPQFFVWLQTLDCSKIKVFAIDEGSVSIDFSRPE